MVERKLFSLELLKRANCNSIAVIRRMIGTMFSLSFWIVWGTGLENCEGDCSPTTQESQWKKKKYSNSNTGFVRESRNLTWMIALLFDLKFLWMMNPLLFNTEPTFELPWEGANSTEIRLDPWRSVPFCVRLYVDLPWSLLGQVQHGCTRQRFCCVWHMTTGCMANMSWQRDTRQVNFKF